MCALSAVCFFHYIACLSFSLSHSFYLSLGSFHYIFASDDNFLLEGRGRAMVCFHFNYTNIDVKPNQNKTKEKKNDKKNVDFMRTRWLNQLRFLCCQYSDNICIYCCRQKQQQIVVQLIVMTVARIYRMHVNFLHFILCSSFTLCFRFYLSLGFCYSIRKHFIPTLYLFQTKRIEAKSLLHT